MLPTLAVFQGGFLAGDVALVADVPDYEAINLIDSLAAKSLVDVTRASGGNLRHRLLETVRLFALSRLIDAKQADATRDRHIEHFSNDPGGRIDGHVVVPWRHDEVRAGVRELPIGHRLGLGA